MCQLFKLGRYPLCGHPLRLLSGVCGVCSHLKRSDTTSPATDSSHAEGFRGEDPGPKGQPTRWRQNIVPSANQASSHSPEPSPEEETNATDLPSDATLHKTRRDTEVASKLPFDTATQKTPRTANAHHGLGKKEISETKKASVSCPGVLIRRRGRVRPARSPQEPQEGQESLQRQRRRVGRNTEAKTETEAVATTAEAITDLPR